MRFMFIVKSSAVAQPPPALMEAMHKFAAEEISAGRMLDDGGLASVAAGTQIRLAKSKLTFTDGPFTETKEVIGGFAVFELRSKEEAISSAQKFMQLHKDHMPEWEGVCEIRQIVGSMSKPL
jgi:hypothetical protein